MSTNIYAFTPDTDPTYQKHKKILLACKEAEVSLPKETAEYFWENDPEEYLLEQKLQVELEKWVHYEEYNEEYWAWFEIDVSKIPQWVSKIRFLNSW